MTYIPKLNDYVEWQTISNVVIQGWIYFVCDEYLTIEASVRPKPILDYKQSKIHANNRLLILCYNQQWNQLKYVKSRSSIYEES